MGRLRELRADGSSVVHDLPDAGLVIGRGEGVGLYVDDARASRVHARIRPTHPGWMIESLAPHNPVMVGGHPVTERRLNHGDRIRVGETQLQFDDPQASPAPPHIGEVEFEPLGRGVPRTPRRRWGLAMLCCAIGTAGAAAILILTGWIGEVLEPTGDSQAVVPWEERFGE